MLEIKIPKSRFYNDETMEFITIPETVLHLEHSLVSISKWESKWHKTFLSKAEKTPEERLDYIRCMTLDKSVDPNVYYALTPSNVDEINAYIENPMTATVLRKTEEHGAPKKDKTTAELIYYYMIALNIPFECQKWHLNRLLTLIEVCGRKNAPPKKRGKPNLAGRNRLNAERRARLGSRG